MLKVNVGLLSYLRTYEHKRTHPAPPLALQQVTGEASSENRLALMASVSNAGKSVEPQSLACAVDVTPGDVGGGPLGSTVLIEQVKRAGALSKVNRDLLHKRHPSCFTDVDAATTDSKQC